MSIAVLRQKGTRLESQLHWPAESWLLDKGFITSREFRTPWGISDLVGIKVNLERTLLRISLGQTDPLGDVCSIMVLLKTPTAASRRSVSAEELVAALGDLMGKTEVEKNIQRLRKKKILLENAAGRFSRETPWLPYHDEFVSVELKLQRVEEALKQARRHKTITSSSYVGLPRALANRVVSSSRKEDFIQSGVGLLAIDGNDCTETLPPVRMTNDLERAYEIAAADRCWSRVLKTIQH